MNEPANIYHAIQNELTALISNYSSYTCDEIKREALEGSIKFYDANELRKLLIRYKPASILEVGSFLGFSTRWLLEVSAPWNAKITAVDPNIRHRIFDQPRSIALKLNAKYLSNRLEVVEAFFGPLVKCSYYYWLYETYEPRLDKKAVDQILGARQILDNNWPYKYDLIFIDGEHSYEAVKSNFITALELLNDGGKIIFHDAFHPGVGKLINEIRFEYGKKAKVQIHAGFLQRFKSNSYLSCLLNLPDTDGLCEFSMT